MGPQSSQSRSRASRSPSPRVTRGEHRSARCYVGYPGRLASGRCALVRIVASSRAGALAKDRVAKRAFEALSYTHQKEHARAIAEAKKPETRARRLALALAMLKSGKKPS